MTSVITITLQTGDQTLTKESQGYTSNDLSDMLSELKNVKEEVNSLLSEMIESSAENKTDDLDEFEDDEDSEVHDQNQITNGGDDQLNQKRTQKNDLYTSKKKKDS